MREMNFSPPLVKLSDEEPMARGRLAVFTNATKMKFNH
jgi:hypothetical protein